MKHSLALLFVLCLVPNLASGAGVVGDGTAASCTESALDAALAGGGAVTFSCGGPATIRVRRQKVISADTSIDGAGNITLLSSGRERFFHIQSSQLSLSNIKLRGGRATTNAGPHLDPRRLGGSILNSEGSLIAENITIERSAAFSGGAIFNDQGTVELRNSSLTRNHALRHGGAIAQRGGTTTVRSSRLTRNRAGVTVDGDFGHLGNIDGDGGAIANGSTVFAGGALTLEETQVSLNTSTYRAGGVASQTAGATTLRRSSISLCGANLGGGIVHFPVDGTGTLTLDQTTIELSAAGTAGGALTFGNTTIADSTFRQNVARRAGGGPSGAKWRHAR